jgi:hypothetical protein
MKPSDAQIIDVISARHTKTQGMIDLVVTVDKYPGFDGPTQVPYTWNTNEDYDNSWNVAAWFAEHPEFVIEPYVPPVPSADPNDYPLTMRQLRLGLVLNGFPVDFIQTAIAAIPDAMQRAIATIWYEETSTNIQWSHPMTQSLIAAAGISAEQAAAMWMAAKDYDA